MTEYSEDLHIKPGRSNQCVDCAKHVYHHADELACLNPRKDRFANICLHHLMIRYHNQEKVIKDLLFRKKPKSHGKKAHKFR
jgi:hypothetical protein